MKKLLTTIITISFLLLPFTVSFAQQGIMEIDEIGAEIEIPEVAEEEETEEERQGSLADTLEETRVEEIQPQRRSFWTVLGAILIPAIFIILCYFMLKFFQA